MNLFFLTPKGTDGHEKLMSGLKEFIQKVPFLANGEALIGLVFLLSGAAVCRDGLLKLQELWVLFRPFFPLSLSDRVAEWASLSFPFIFSTFITVIGSICAVIIGALWLVSGLVEIVQSRRRAVNPGEFAHPELAAESLRSAEVEHWRSFPWSFRTLARRWPRVRLISPISLQVIRDTVRSAAKIVLLGLLIALILAGLPWIPALLKRFFQVTVALSVPSGKPLYFLLALLVCANLLICLSVVPFRKKQFRRSCEVIPVHGGGDAHLFFALLEEGSKLLSAKGGSPAPPTRLEAKNDPATKGTLIESRPEAVRTFLRPAGYFCLPLVFLLVTMGFSRLIHFRGLSASMHYTQFLGLHSLNYLLEVAFALGLILSGLYLAEWARKLFAVRNFGSSLVFCCMRSDRELEASAQDVAVKAAHPRRPAMSWKPVREVDDQLAAWAKRPQSSRRFKLELSWAHVSSESAEADGPRFLIELDSSEALERAMKRILDIPFHVNFRVEGPDPHQKSEEPHAPVDAPVKSGARTDTKTPQ